MGEFDAFNQKHPFLFKIEGAFGFKKYIQGLIEENLIDLALDHIETIREKYVIAKKLNQIPIEKSFIYSHFQSYREEEFQFTQKGKTYPDGSTDKVVFVLNQLAKEASKLKGDKKDTLTIPEKGIVLYFLMYHGNGKFKITRNSKSLEEYLKKIGLSGSGKTVYNKGIVHLMEDSDREDHIKRGKVKTKGVFTRNQFLNAIKYLHKIDKKAYQTAQNEFDFYCAESIEGGNNQIFFKL